MTGKFLIIFVATCFALASCRPKSQGASDVLNATASEQTADIEERFLHAQRFAARVVKEFPAEGLPESAPAWIQTNRKKLSETIFRSKHQWKDGASPNGACAFAETDAHGTPLVILYRSACDQDELNPDAIAKLLIHESCHHLGETSESFCDQVAELTFEAWAWEQRLEPHGSWHQFSTVDSPPYEEKNMIWAGDRIVLVGGFTSPDEKYVATYTPRTGAWQKISEANASRKYFWRNQSVWTGKEVFLWGGHERLTLQAVHEGVLLDPRTGRWRTVNRKGAPRLRPGHSAVWTGNVIILWGQAVDSDAASGGIYNPATNSWRTLPLQGSPAGRVDHTAVWTGSKMIVWGGVRRPLNPFEQDDTTRSVFSDGGIFDPSAGTWAPLASQGAPQRRKKSTAVWTGKQVFVWESGGLMGKANGALYDPKRDRWKPISDKYSLQAPQGEIAFDVSVIPNTAAWTGQHVVLVGMASHPGDSNFALSYEPEIDRWRALPRVDHTAVISPTAVWNGKELFVWAGRDPVLRDRRAVGLTWSPSSAQ